MGSMWARWADGPHFAHLAHVYTEEVGNIALNPVITGLSRYFQKYWWAASGQRRKWAASGHR